MYTSKEVTTQIQSQYEFYVEPDFVWIIRLERNRKEVIN